MLHKLNSLQYHSLIDYANAHDCGAVYPLSVAEGIQDGDIFTDSLQDYEKVLFWAHSGFAYLSGNIDEHFLEEIYELMLDRTKSNTKRFLLMTRDKYVQEFFESKDDVIEEKRYLFKYSGTKGYMASSLPDGYELKEIDNRLLEKISGKIVPSLFWKDLNNFIAKGKGYCITCNNDMASWAFSAAVSTKEIDIGIETKPEYKQQGLGMIVANKMIQYTTGQAKEPVWACHYKNTASEKMAEKLGFIKASECSIIKSKY
ncbi:MAG: GNAT family N-acetyltransferase [Lachnospiraceae bacterium]|nr:GNAT family N-acetyltransferase [Lachnospiraceae bacterium]